MTKTTVEKLKLTAKELTSLSDDALKQYINDAWLEVEKANFPERFQDKANRYLAAHLATLADKNVKSEAVGSLKREYSGKNVSFMDLKSSPYGQEYLRLLNTYGNGGNGLNLVVL